MVIKKNFLVLLEPSGVQFEVGPGETLVEAAQRLGVDQLRFGCQLGGCGRCKLQVLTGEYQHEDLSWIHVSKEEESKGITLACCTRALGDLVITQEL
ncbi:MAG: hypothetical protein A2527_13390 [Candidatus Lambdaproteobacteria bacterium RIFOXYD2_FULL_50_16]|uniref:2Fe-2S ferredoxin-type domain-containing protein n=1 Tax=Candidatus Lambdaproteobacteria bacterium RIFOXYD2_FULL_50_16 TaxID=1817772 RepID=A0A1F6G551_9PROT|nr:MAG: hypothetical protein A2527_13390 [Candidatus Lambdaproteobacteria bacterium RIFOXYD2_FULL_50_16]